MQRLESTIQSCRKRLVGTLNCRLMAVAVECGQDSLNQTADEAEQAIDNVGNDVLGGVEGQDDLGKNAEADKAMNAGANLGADFDIVLAALGAVTNTINVALAKTELAGGALESLNALEGIEGDIGFDVSSNGGEAKNVGVEGNDGVDNGLDVETEQGSADVFQIRADVGIDVDFHINVDVELEPDAGRSTEGDRVEAGLAVLVVGVVFDNLGGRRSTEAAELDIDADVGADIRLGPGSCQDGADADAGSEVQLLTGRARASLGPAAVAHGLGARIAGVRLAGSAQVDVGIDVNVGVGNGSNFDVGRQTNETGGGSHSGEAGESRDEVHVDRGCFLDELQVWSS